MHLGVDLLRDIHLLTDDVLQAAEIDNVAPMQQACRALLESLPHSPTPIPDEEARRVMLGLRAKRRFVPMRALGAAFLEDGCQDPAVSRHLAQSMIELGEGQIAIRILESLIARPDLEREEWAEAKGGLGRAWKDLAVRLRVLRRGEARHAAQTAASHYADVWSQGERDTYQGINFVAITLWGGETFFDADRISAARQAAKRIAQRCKDVLANATSPDAWTLATLGEARLALGDLAGAQSAFSEYTALVASEGKNRHPFALASTVRQLVTLWSIGDRDGGASLLAPMVGALGSMPGGAFSVPGPVFEAMAAVPESRHEAVFGTDHKLRTYDWLQQGFLRAKSVGMVLRNGKPHGTGFVLRARDVGLPGDGVVFLTSNHVLSDPPHYLAARPQEAQIRFEIASRQDPTSWLGVKRLLWQSPDHELDISVAELDGPLPAGVAPLDLSQALPRLGTAEARIFVIGHPLGGTLAFSLEDNLILDYEQPPHWAEGSPAPRRIHYRTPTEKGSSGSPVFDETWRVIGIHRAGEKHMPRLNGLNGTYEANEAVWIGGLRIP